MRLLALFTAATAGLAALALLTFAGPSESWIPLLDAGKNHSFTDIGSDTKTVPELVDSKELGGKVWKIGFAVKDTVGDRTARVKDWKSSSALRIRAFNPGKERITLVLNVFHSGTKNYDTRLVVPIQFQPGRNDIRLAIAELANVNGSAPALGSVTRWFLADEAEKAPTLLVAGLWLEGFRCASRQGPGRPGTVGTYPQGNHAEGERSGAVQHTRG
jgi:hypothetical protein